MYSNAKYAKNLFGQEIGIEVEINGVTSFVPLDPANSDYAALLASGEPIAPTPTPPAPAPGAH